ncbi:MAG TPA: hypothetical protein VFX44_06610 [Solirubrobacterales bacterium]|nr:hypothetical protein [Solirubrobacterales bacterium]
MPTTVAKRKKSSVAPLGEETKPSLVFGITFDLNGKAIPVTGVDVARWKEQGGELKLPEPVEVGSIEGFIEVMEEKFGVKIPKASELPEPIKAVVEGITSMVVTVHKAEVKIPGTKSKDQVTRYLIEVSGLSKKGIPLVPGFPLSIKGLSVGATNKPAETETE